MGSCLHVQTRKREKQMTGLLSCQRQVWKICIVQFCANGRKEVRAFTRSELRLALNLNVHEQNFYSIIWGYRRIDSACGNRGRRSNLVSTLTFKITWHTTGAEGESVLVCVDVSQCQHTKACPRTLSKWTTTKLRSETQHGFAIDVRLHFVGRLFLCTRECVCVCVCVPQERRVLKKRRVQTQCRETLLVTGGVLCSGWWRACRGPTSHPEVTLAFFCPSDV